MVPAILPPELNCTSTCVDMPRATDTGVAPISQDGESGYDSWAWLAKLSDTVTQCSPPGRPATSYAPPAPVVTVAVHGDSPWLSPNDRTLTVAAARAGGVLAVTTPLIEPPASRIRSTPVTFSGPTAMAVAVLQESWLSNASDAAGSMPTLTQY